MDRNERNCFYHSGRYQNGCACLNDDVVCVPSECTWHRTKQEVLESLDKARRIYEKSEAHKGKMDYIRKYCPASLQKELKEYGKE